MKPKLSLDAVLKDFFQRKERLADLLNAALLEGNPFIRPDMVEIMDSDSSSVVEVEEGHFTTGKRQRDKLFYIHLHDDKGFIIGLEFQSTVDYRMVLRILYYICDTLAREEKLRNTPLNIISLVLFSGEGRWNAKTSLKELAGKIENERLNELFFDFSYEVRDLKKMDTSRLRNKEVKDAVEGIQLVYAGTEEILKERREISKASLLVIIAATGNIELYNEIMKEKGERFVMCEAFERWTKDKIEIGRMEGKSEGRKEGKREIFINLIEMKIGKLSEGLREQLNGCSDRVFELLVERFYQLNDEKEIRQILFS